MDEARLKELVRLAADGHLSEVTDELEPGERMALEAIEGFHKMFPDLLLVVDS